MRFLIILFLVVSSVSRAQDSTLTTEIRIDKAERRKMEFAGVYKSSISLEIFGKSGFVGASYDVLLSRKWRLGLGAGYAGGGADLKFYPFGVKRDAVLLNIGFRANAFLQPNSTHYRMYSLPIGLSLFTVNRMNLELDVGPMMNKIFTGFDEPYSGFASNINFVWFSMKVGYRFSFYAMKRARKLNKED